MSTIKGPDIKCENPLTPWTDGSPVVGERRTWLTADVCDFICQDCPHEAGSELPPNVRPDPCNTCTVRPSNFEEKE
jgi:hypothetical protein